MNIKLFAILALILLATVFILQNAEVVELSFLFWKLSMSSALMFVFLVLIGTVTGWFLRGHFVSKARRKSLDPE